jgi:putative FmdB family regulatory protein
MPIYEYVCEDCGHALEALRKISDTPLLACPACEMDALKKKISAPRFRLSGSGWYETDFKSQNQKNLAKGDSADSSSSSKSDSANSSSSTKGGSAASSSSTKGDSADSSSSSKSDKPASGGSTKSGAKSGGKEAAA